MASRFSFPLMRLTTLAALGLATSLSSHAVAQSVHFSTPYQDDSSSKVTSKKSTQKTTAPATHGGEHFHATGHRPPPPGYQDVPSTEFENGPDPDHEAHLRSNRDAVTGSNLGHFGSAYQDSNPIQGGKMGDATGNGWVAPRGNGF